MKHHLWLQLSAKTRWQKTVWECLALANHVCQRCHVRPAVTAHHLNYDSLGFERPSDLLAICDECHERLHYPEAANDNDPPRPALQLKLI